MKTAVKIYLERQNRMKRDLKDLAILDKKADKLNKEAEDVLAYQTQWRSQEN